MPEKTSPPSTPRRRRRRRILALSGVLLLGALAATFGGLLRGWMQEGAQLAKEHARHRVSHRGWSFPAAVYSRPVLLEESMSRLLAEALARGYQEECQASPPRPGTYCAAPARVVPRRGLALEPLLLGFLIGPDAELREHLPLEEAPAHLVHALIAAEDRHFFDHRGVNLRALARATVVNARGGGYAQGGSTLSMQVVRGLSGRREKQLWRKLRELGLALGLERELGKQGVLQMYLDLPYLGQKGGLSVCGFAAAARHYFAKEAQELSLAEAATLVAVLPSPATLGPRLGTQEVRGRAQRVLRSMAEQFGYEVEEALLEEVLKVESQALPERHPAYLSATRLWLEANLPPEVLYGKGLRVETGIDLPLQEETERLFEQKLPHFQAQLGRGKGQKLQGAGVALDPHTGSLRAIYGGRELTSTGFNRALQARRQPGSSFKPLVFALAFSLREQDGRPSFTAASTLPNSPRDFLTVDGPWRPRNVAGDYTPTASLAYALIWSQNIATASLLEELGGPQRLIEFAQGLGFDTASFPAEPGLALGQAETTVAQMTRFAALLANGGHQVEVSPVWRAVDLAGVERVSPPALGERVLEALAAPLTRELMRRVVEQGTGTTSRGFGGEVGYRGLAMGKTGTTDEEKDLWFVGATPKVAMAVWLGFDRPARLGANASEVAAPLWGWWMARAMAHEPGLGTFPAEPRLLQRAICSESGRLAGPGCRRVGAPFSAGTEPTSACTLLHPPVEEPEPLPPGG